MSTIGVVASAAGGVEQLREGLVVPLLHRGHQVAITLTPTAAEWLAPAERWELERLTQFPVRSHPRRPGEARHPAWAGHLATLRAAGVVLVEWELLEPRATDGRALPWGRILAAVSG
ncbi:hypothetical protein ACQHIV_38795 [Kribbella sp. GL6]|uniref:hypothetical protein n=1 Tax=Kribbella sp. GL6 TaxID=3419765 RepID=UPI003D05364E